MHNTTQYVAYSVDGPYYIVHLKMGVDTACCQLSCLQFLRVVYESEYCLLVAAVCVVVAVVLVAL
jgi:hypothetical protein